MHMHRGAKRGSKGGALPWTLGYRGPRTVFLVEYVIHGLLIVQMVLPSSTTSPALQHMSTHMCVCVCMTAVLAVLLYGAET